MIAGTPALPFWESASFALILHQGPFQALSPFVANMGHPDNNATKALNIAHVDDSGLKYTCVGTWQCHICAAAP